MDALAASGPAIGPVPVEFVLFAAVLAGVDGAPAGEALSARLATIDAVVQNQDNREHDILDSDEYWQFQGGLAASVCLRSPGAVEEARKVAAGYRRRVIGAIAGARPVGESTCAVLIDDPALVGDVATALAGPAGGPVLVAARNGDMVRVSTRADGAVPLGPLVRQLASEAGGSGGGHARRAGGSVPADGFLGFAAAFAEAVGA